MGITSSHVTPRVHNGIGAPSCDVCPAMELKAGSPLSPPPPRVSRRITASVSFTDYGRKRENIVSPFSLGKQRAYVHLRVTRSRMRSFRKWCIPLMALQRPRAIPLHLNAPLLPASAASRESLASLSLSSRIKRTFISFPRNRVHSKHSKISKNE